MNKTVPIYVAMFMIVGKSLFAQTMPHGKDFTLSCILCHHTATWEVNRDSLTFDHGETAFPLEGVHGSTRCRDCHATLVFKGTPGQCISCHTDVHAGELGASCADCHTSERWIDKRKFRDHHQELQFPLTGVHALLDCDDCHPGKQYRFAVTPVTCYDCHQGLYETAVNPDHRLAGFSRDCIECHTETFSDWRNTVYRHTQSFVLEGGHDGLSCTDCHASRYSGTDAACMACHEDDYKATYDPDHEAFGFFQDCQVCHTVFTWETATFNHEESSGFVLNGTHKTLQCIECHVDNRQTGLARDCYGCHETDYSNTADPGHVANHFSFDCLQCHDEWQWIPAVFDHGATAFPLSGMHATVRCIECHTAGYENTPADCWSCHEPDYAAAADPNHTANNFSRDCTECHSFSGWLPATFDHTGTTFPLTGAHAALSCIECHADGYLNTPAECWSCHEPDYAAAADPDHTANNFSRDCSECHSFSGWLPATFDHTGTTFPLTGAHAALSCIECHADGYRNTPADCWSCHEPDYSAAADPDHTANNFSHECVECHSFNGWQPATFDHTGTAFPLTGAHAALSCIECHADGYRNTPADCWSCHESDYNGAEAIDHKAAHFPSDCLECHTTNAWLPADWNHDALYFPIYSGSHRNEWDDCSDCHSNGSDYTAFSCLLCHAHRQSKMDDEHDDVSGYYYDSAACYSCHPRGRH